jgi:hypothetical protein
LKEQQPIGDEVEASYMISANSAFNNQRSHTPETTDNAFLPTP